MRDWHFSADYNPEPDEGVCMQIRYGLSYNGDCTDATLHGFETCYIKNVFACRSPDLIYLPIDNWFFHILSVKMTY